MKTNKDQSRNVELDRLLAILESHRREDDWINDVWRSLDTLAYRYTDRIAELERAAENCREKEERQTKAIEDRPMNIVLEDILRTMQSHHLEAKWIYDAWANMSTLGDRYMDRIAELEETIGILTVDREVHCCDFWPPAFVGFMFGITIGVLVFSFWAAVS